jgi:hypothetical protein
MKNRRDRTQAASDVVAQTPEGSGASPRAHQPEFVRAFVDALRDILRDERARLHG